MCVSPLTVKLPDGTYQSVPCNKCVECMQRKRNDWSLRLQNELKSVKRGFSYFVTLTYDDEHVPCIFDDSDNLLGYTLVRSDVSVFVRSIRDRFRYAAKLQGLDYTAFNIRYFACGEYGSSTLRPHYHLMLFGLMFDIDYTLRFLQKVWSKGFVQIGYLHDGGCHYQAKYMVKPSGLPESAQKPFCQGSKHLGMSYLDKPMINYIRDNGRVLSNRGKFFSVPRYYRNKIYMDKISRDLAARISKQKYMQYLNDVVASFGDERMYEQNRAAYVSRKTQDFFKSLHKRKL